MKDYGPNKVNLNHVKCEGIKSGKWANRVHKKDLNADVALIELDKNESTADVEWIITLYFLRFPTFIIIIIIIR